MSLEVESHYGSGPMTALLASAGEMGPLIAAYDWASTPLGDLEDWPQSLKTATSIILRSPVPIIMLWSDQGIMIYNDAYISFASHKHPQLLGQPVLQGWEEVADFNSHVMEVCMAGGTLSYRNQELTLYRSGQPEQVWMDLDYSPVLGENGEPAGVIAIVVETTQRVLAERRNVVTRDRLTQMFEQAPGFMAMLRESDHVFELANPAYLQLLGKGAEEVIGKRVREVLPEVVEQGLLNVLDEVYSSGKAYVGSGHLVQLRRGADHALQERYLDFVYQPITDTEGKVSGIFVEGFDVTERLEVEAQLQERERQFQNLANSIPQLAWMAEPDGYIFWYNRRWYDFTGTTLEQMKGWGWSAVVPPQQKASIEAEIQSFWEAGEAWEGTYQLRSAEGDYHWFLAQAEPVRNAKGRVVRWFGTNTDITEHRELQDELQQVAARLSEADRRKDEFLATLAHELRNPLAPIRTGLEVMKRSMDDPAMVENIRSMLERQTHQLTTLVDDLLEVSRITQGKLELRMSTVSLREVINIALESAMPAIDKARHSLKVDLPEEIELEADPQRLAQVLSNLLDNAAKYTLKGGHIHLLARRQGQTAEIRVIDNGIGIPSDKLESIFDMFTQIDRPFEKSYTGLGIGLTLVKSLLELHRGSISVNSAGPEQGSEFVIHLPIAAAGMDTESSDDSLEEGEDGSQRFRVLVVDDNRDAADTLCMIIEMLGHDVRTAHDGMEAVEAAGQYRPQMILMDLGMPKMDGYEAAREIRRQTWGEHIMLVALSGWGQEEDKRRTQEAGFDQHIIKPADTTALQRLFAELGAK